MDRPARGAIRSEANTPARLTAGQHFIRILEKKNYNHAQKRDLLNIQHFFSFFSRDRSFADKDTRGNMCNKREPVLDSSLVWCDSIKAIRFRFADRIKLMLIGNGL